MKKVLAALKATLNKFHVSRAPVSAVCGVADARYRSLYVCARLLASHPAQRRVPSRDLFSVALTFLCIFFSSTSISIAQVASENAKPSQVRKGEITSRSTAEDFDISPGDAPYHQAAVDAINRFLYLYRLPGNEKDNPDLEKARIDAWSEAIDYLDMPSHACANEDYPYLAKIVVPCDTTYVPPANPPRQVKELHEKASAVPDNAGSSTGGV